MARANSVSETLSYAIDLASGRASALAEVSLASVGLRERDHLQTWISEFPEMVGSNLLLITSEFDQWEIRDQRVSDRLDVLFLDSDGSPLVAELKRDQAADTTELQALKYAAYCSQLTVDDVVDEYARFHQIERQQAHAKVVDHAPSLEEGTLGSVRVRLIAGGFGPAVTHVVLWLNDLGLDIGCVEVTARALTPETAIVTARQVLPPPSAEDYFVRRRRRLAEEEEVESYQRRRNSVVVLEEAGLLAPGDEVTMNLGAFSAADLPVVQAAIGKDPPIGVAEWTGLGIRNALRWRHDGKLYSCTGLIETLREQLGLKRTAIPGPDYWLVPSGRTFYQESLSLEDRRPVAEPLSEAMVKLPGSSSENLGS